MAKQNINEDSGEKRTPSQFFLELSKTKMPRIDEKREINDPSQNRINNISIKKEVPVRSSENSLRIKNLDLTRDTVATDGVIPVKRESMVNESSSEHLAEAKRPAPSNRRQQERRGGHSKRALVLVAFFVIVSAIFALSKLFTGATVYVEPKVFSNNIDINLNMKRDSSEGLSFERVNLSASLEKTVSSSGTENVETKSTGRAILYNNHSTTPQKLLINTRLEDSTGKIYFTDAVVTIPGRTTKGGETIPGSVEVGITAEKAGEAYNGAPRDFVFVGFKGTPKEKTFYARGKGDTTGGFVGLSPVVGEEDKAGAIAMLQEELKAKLISDVSLQVPSGYIVRDSLSFIKFSESKIEMKEESAVISLSGTIDAFIIPVDKFATVMAEKNITDYNGESIRIDNLDSLSISLKDKDIIENPGSLTSTDITIIGDPLFVYGFPKEELISALVGKKKKEFPSVVSMYPTIKSARVVLKPFFSTTLPEPEDIVVIESLPTQE